MWNLVVYEPNGDRHTIPNLNGVRTARKLAMSIAEGRVKASKGRLYVGFWTGTFDESDELPVYKNTGEEYMSVRIFKQRR